MADAQVIDKEACPKCREKGGDTHGDNLAVYDDGGKHCFACGHHVHKNSKDGKPAAPRSKPMFEKIQMIEELELRALAKRGITEETCKKFNYKVGKNRKGNTVQVANYMTDGKVVAQKVRAAGKKFMTLGDFKGVQLYGQHLWRDGGKRLIITEGEIDALSISQVQGNKWPVVSVPNGAQGAAASIARNIEFVESYDVVVLAFDMDEPGQIGAKECAALLSPGKAYIANLPLKDANECLVKGYSKELISALWDAKVYRPDGVIDVDSIIDDACKPIEIGKSWPWDGMKNTYGRRTKEVYGFGGGTGCGKSTVFKQVMKHIIEVDNLPVGGIFLEEPPAHTLRTLTGMFVGKRLHVPGVEYDRDSVRRSMEQLCDKVYFYDHFGSSKFETIKEKIRYMVHSLGIKDIFLDHLTALAAGVEGNEREAIDKIMAEISSLTQELDCTIYYISHLTTPEGTPHEEGGRVLEKQFRGSRSIAYWSHFLFGIERDKQDKDGITILRTLKDRYTGDSNGDVMGLAYNTDTGLLEECDIPKEGDDVTFDPIDENSEHF